MQAGRGARKSGACSKWSAEEGMENCLCSVRQPGAAKRRPNFRREKTADRCSDSHDGVLVQDESGRARRHRRAGSYKCLSTMKQEGGCGARGEGSAAARGAASTALAKECWIRDGEGGRNGPQGGTRWVKRLSNGLAVPVTHRPHVPAPDAGTKPGAQGDLIVRKVV